MAQYAQIPASPEWRPSLSNEHRSNILTRTKRKADDELDSQSHISSQLKKLRLNQSLNNLTHANGYINALPSHTYVPQHLHPAPAISAPASASTDSQPHAAQLASPATSFRPLITNTDARPPLAAPHPQIDHHDFALTPSLPQSKPPIPNPPLTQSAISTTIVHTDHDTDFMPIDETPHRIVIHDLDTEIAQIEAEEASHAQSLFTPDIDKKISGELAQHLLQGGGGQGQNHDRNAPSHHMSQLGMRMDRPPENLNTALILYRDPISISVPEEEDAVRKSIIEARKRVRERNAEKQRERARLEQEAARNTLQQQSWNEVMPDSHHLFHEPRDEDHGMDDDLDADPMDIE